MARTMNDPEFWYVVCPICRVTKTERVRIRRSLDDPPSISFGPSEFVDAAEWETAFERHLGDHIKETRSVGYLDGQKDVLAAQPKADPSWKELAEVQRDLITHLRAGLPR